MESDRVKPSGRAKQTIPDTMTTTYTRRHRTINRLPAVALCKRVLVSYTVYLHNVHSMGEKYLDFIPLRKTSFRANFR